MDGQMLNGESQNDLPAKYPGYLPTWPKDLRYPISGPFEHYEHAKDANPTFPDLLSEAKVIDLTPTTGSEISGPQLASLSREGKDQLALFCAQRKVLAFRDQNFKDLPAEEILKWCSYFGRPSIHPTGPTPADGPFPEIHIAHSGGPDTRLSSAWSKRTNSLNWHLDGSVDPQPPGLVFLYLLESPPTGGDTVFCNTAELYRRLSPEFAKRLHGLKAEHSDIDLVERTKATSGEVKREGVSSIHPMVRTHPVTNEKAIFVNPIYTTKIIGYKAEECELLLKFLYDQIAFAQDCQVRVRWEPGTVVVFDNRAICHSAIFDFLDNRRRHVARVALSAEKPFETAFEDSKKDLDERNGHRMETLES